MSDLGRKRPLTIFWTILLILVTLVINETLQILSSARPASKARSPGLLVIKCIVLQLLRGCTIRPERLPRQAAAALTKKVAVLGPTFLLLLKDHHQDFFHQNGRLICELASSFRTWVLHSSELAMIYCNSAQFIKLTLKSSIWTTIIARFARTSA